MQEITGAVRGGRIVLSESVIGANTSHDHLALRLTLDGAWDGLSLTAQFCDAHGGAVTMPLLREADGTVLVPIPYAAAKYAGTAHFTLRGVLASGETETLACAAAQCDLTVLASGWDSGAEEAAQPDATVAAGLQAQIETKVDKVEGKGLSQNDYTDEEKAKVDAMAAALETKVNKVEGKGLSTNDYTDEEKAKVDATAAALETKVDKVAGKGLSQNDYTDEEKHANKSVLDAITDAMLAAGQKIAALLKDVKAVVRELGTDDTTIPTSRAVKVALDGKQDKLILHAAATPNELDTALAVSSTVTLTGDVNYDRVLTIPEGKTLELAGFNLYVKGLVNHGVLAKSGGRLWANIGYNKNTAVTGPVSIADVSNLWAANEVLLTPGTELDGIRLINNNSTVNNAGTKSAVETYLPHLFATGAGFLNVSNGCYYFLIQIPEGKAFDLNGKNMTCCATVTTLGAGEVYDSVGGGKLGLYMDDSAGRGTYEHAVAIADSRPTERIFRIQQATGNRDYASRAPIPANAMFIVSAGTAASVTFFVSNEAGFTRVGTSDAKATGIRFKLAGDVELTKQIDLGSKAFDYNGHFITGGGSVVTTGAVLHTNGGGNLGAIVADFEARIRALEGGV